MCGILGGFSFRGAPFSPAELSADLACLAHRGPDDATYWQADAFAFGHRRLSIIDLTQGRQPMEDAGHDLVVTFNGEIYNYVELRQELAADGAVFRTQSDTEVLLHGYRRWGTGLPARLVGMYAFAIADMHRQELFLARDPFGEKPLLYADAPDRVLFASELAPLSRLLGAKRSFNTSALPGYLCLNYVPGDETLMAGVRRVPAGTWRQYRRDGGVSTGISWRPPGPMAEELDERSAIDRVEALLEQSVRLSLRSDVPVGIFLSGGIDSALIARLASEQGTLAHAFCLTFDEASYSEWERASQTARQLQIPLTRVRMDVDAMTSFPEIVAHADDPLADSSALAVYTLSKAAARDVKVVLSGDGGDELFGGYLTYKATAWHNRTTSRLPGIARRGLSALGRRFPTGEGKVSTSYKLMRYLRAADLPSNEAHFSWNGVWLPEEAAGLLRGPELKGIARGALRALAVRHGLPVRPGLRDLQRADIADYLPNDILAKADRMSMAHGLEVRAPFLNPALAALALSLPDRLKVSATGPTKRILRALAARRYGAGIANAGKQGFSIPVHTWLRGAARPLLEDLLSPDSVSRIDVLDARAVAGAVEAHMSGRRSLGFELWGLMVLVAWHRRHILGTPSVPDGAPPARLDFLAQTAL